MKPVVILIALLSVLPSAAIAGAKIQYSAYEGPETIRTGEGGTKVSKNGVDYWTSGTPPRRYQVIGLITDKRDEVWDGGHAVGSPKVSRMVKEAGADGVIISSQTEGGATGGGGIGGIFAMGGSKTMTTMVVIRYLPQP